MSQTRHQQVTLHFRCKLRVVDILTCWAFSEGLTSAERFVMMKCIHYPLPWEKWRRDSWPQISQRARQRSSPIRYVLHYDWVLWFCLKLLNRIGKSVLATLPKFQAHLSIAGKMIIPPLRQVVIQASRPYWLAVVVDFETVRNLSQPFEIKRNLLGTIRSSYGTGMAKWKSQWQQVPFLFPCLFFDSHCVNKVSLCNDPWSFVRPSAWHKLKTWTISMTLFTA